MNSQNTLDTSIHMNKQTQRAFKYYKLICKLYELHKILPNFTNQVVLMIETAMKSQKRLSRVAYPFSVDRDIDPVIFFQIMKGYLDGDNIGEATDCPKFVTDEYIDDMIRCLC